MEDNSQKLMEELFVLARVLADRWGVGTETPFGNIAVSTYDQIVWHEGEGISSATISIHCYNAGYWARKTHDIYEASADDLIDLGRQLASMAQYFACDAFQAKVEGSISLLKRLNKALES